MVPPINGGLYFKALKEPAVAAEYLPRPAGGHGFRLLDGGLGGTNWESWQQAALVWIKRQEFIPGTCPAE